MSYNITRFILKNIDNLKIPVASFYKHPRTDWHPKEIEEDGLTTFRLNECSLQGIVRSDVFCCDGIDCHDEGSGTYMKWILEPALSDSTGTLEVVCIWEGGDEIQRLIVEDGRVKWIDIEL